MDLELNPSKGASASSFPSFLESYRFSPSSRLSLPTSFSTFILAYAFTVLSSFPYLKVF